MAVMDKTNKAAQFITKLLRLTQEKKIRWTTERSPRNDGRAAFLTEVEGKTLRLYRSREEVDAHELLTLTKIGERTCLDVLDHGLATYTFAGVSGLRDLYESVAYSASNVDEFMDAVLEKN